MASILPRLRQVNVQLELLLPAEMIVQACRDAGWRFRKRVLDPVRTIHIMVLQLLAHTSLRGVRIVAGLKVSKQAIAQARKRLPLNVMLQLVQSLCDRATACLGGQSDWHGHRLVMLDGTCGRVDDTPELSRRYGKSRNQRGLSTGCPVIRLLALLDASTGLIRKIISMPYRGSELRAFVPMLQHLVSGDLLLADRGLVSFAHLALLLSKGVCCCIRLPRSMIVQGRGKASRRKLRQLGRQDLLVEWRRGTRPRWMSKPRFALLPDTLTLRQISFQLHRKGYRSIWVWIITDRLDPVRYPAMELAKLYARRWQIEVDFRDLKCTLHMKHLRSRTEASVRKELAAFVILYNLIRLTMLHSARAQKVDPTRISFIDTAQWLLWSDCQEPLAERTVNQARRRKTQPRAIKNYRRNFGRLTKPRKLMERPAYDIVL